MVRIFIGYDANEVVAYHVLCQSILENASQPITICPLKLSTLKVFDRRREQLQSTEFSFSRFLVPYLSDYEGTSIFMDCDMLVKGDVFELIALADPKKAVSVVKHIYEPKTDKKFLDNVQTKYEKKNWSSVMVFQNKLCRRLTPEYVNTASGLELHQFKWLDSEEEIGSLPLEWNHLVGEYEGFIEEPKLLHYTLGGPYFEAYQETEHADDWFHVFNRTVFARN